MCKQETTGIPRRIFLFWEGPRPPFVDWCIQRIRTLHGSWSVHLFTEVEEWVEGLDALQQVQWKSDWVRMCALQDGGVWLDASCICTQPVDRWVDMAADAVQGFSAPFASDSLENWAFAAPPSHPLLIRWKQLFQEAIEMGFDAFKAKAPPHVRTHAIYGWLPYLTMHACYLIAAEEMGVRARMTPASDGPYRYLCDHGWDSPRAVEALMHAPLDHPPPPLIKLRGSERSWIASLECRRGSLMHRLGMKAGSGATEGVDAPARAVAPGSGGWWLPTMVLTLALVVLGIVVASIRRHRT